jgi:divalent metal cation (Fe/Co/Zn/Cd) transporter
VGRAAPQEFVQKLEQLADSHHHSMQLDVIRAYHFGARYIVEMEVVMPAAMTVVQSHDIALVLQHKVRLPGDFIRSPACLSTRLCAVSSA